MNVTSLDNNSIDKNFPLLSSLENLGALSSKFGILEIKPFRDWKDAIWKHKVFSMRLCNSGEMLSIYSYLESIPNYARVQATKIEVLIRSLYAINEQPLVSAESLASYNDTHKTQLSTLDFMRLWTGNLEQVVLDRLDMVYGGLQLKQERQLQGIYLCGNCENTFTKIPEGSKTLKYSLSEIVCSSCLKGMKEEDLAEFDFEGTAESTSVEKSFNEIPKFICPDCQLELPDRESFTEHRSTSCKAGATV